MIDINCILEKAIDIIFCKNTLIHFGFSLIGAWYKATCSNDLSPETKNIFNKASEKFSFKKLPIYLYNTTIISAIIGTSFMYEMNIFLFRPFSAFIFGYSAEKIIANYSDKLMAQKFDPYLDKIIKHFYENSDSDIKLEAEKIIKELEKDINSVILNKSMDYIKEEDDNES